jgi:hypothetical protein
MEQAKQKKVKPKKIPPYKEDQGTVFTHQAKEVIHKPEENSIEETFAKAANQLLKTRVKDGFIIVKGILDVSTGFPTDTEILNVVEGKKKLSKNKKEMVDILDAILDEPSRKTIMTSPTNLPELYNTLATHIRNPIQSCIDHLNDLNSTKVKLKWKSRQLRDPETCTLLFTTPVPEDEVTWAQKRHIDFLGYNKHCLSCHIGISDNIRLHIYDEDTDKWLEVTYGRGDILLVRGHKFHRGTNHSEPVTKIRSFLYIEDEEYAETLFNSKHAKAGAVFSKGLKDLQGFYDKADKVETVNRVEDITDAVQAKALKRKAGKEKMDAALNEHRRKRAVQETSLVFL